MRGHDVRKDVTIARALQRDERQLDLPPRISTMSHAITTSLKIIALAVTLFFATYGFCSLVESFGH